MLIKTKLRPKELNEFNRWFGDLKHSITPIEGTSRQIQERIRRRESEFTNNFIK